MAKVEEALEIIKGMTLLELRDLNKAIEEEFGITAAAPMMMAAGPAAGGAAPAAAAAEEEKTEFNVVLKSFGDNKINVIKAIREVVSGLGLKAGGPLEPPRPSAEPVDRGQSRHAGSDDGDADSRRQGGPPGCGREGPGKESVEELPARRGLRPLERDTAMEGRRHDPIKDRSHTSDAGRFVRPREW